MVACAFLLELVAYQQMFFGCLFQGCYPVMGLHTIQWKSAIMNIVYAKFTVMKIINALSFQLCKV
jgi:hypothetical protein